MKVIKFFGWVFLCIASLMVVLYVYHFYLKHQAEVTTFETIAADEPQQIERSVHNFLTVSDEQRTHYVARGAHSKGHGCVKAYFKVLQNIPSHLQHGIFSIPSQQYKTWIRFSNGGSSMHNNDDADKDSRGIAIKLINVDDDILAAEGVSKDVKTQDFLMHNSPAFFSVDLEDYNRLVESKDKILYFLSGWNPFNWRLRELSHVNATLAPPPDSPLLDEYYSNTAYQYGPHNIKFATNPCMQSTSSDLVDKSDPDFLRKAMAQTLDKQDGCLMFMVQLQKQDKQMPIEDPSVLWKESDSPFIPVAEVIIPQQTFDTEEQQQFCEALSFSPWNTLKSHRPIGQLNRVRRMVYQASAHFRHKENNTSAPQSLAW